MPPTDLLCALPNSSNTSGEAVFAYAKTARGQRPRVLAKGKTKGASC